MYKRLLCFIIGHQSRITSCPFTLLKYDKCDRCNRSMVIGMVGDEKQNTITDN